jgi:serine/threonine protein kinase
MSLEKHNSIAEAKVNRLSARLGNLLGPDTTLEERFKLQAKILDSPSQVVYSAIDQQNDTSAWVVFSDSDLVWQMIEKWDRLTKQQVGFKSVIAFGSFAGVRFAIYQGLAPDEQLLQDVQITSMEQVTTIIRRLSELLRSMHAENFVYGDLSPATIASSADSEQITITAPLFRHITGYYLEDEQPSQRLIDTEAGEYGPGDFISPLAYSSYWPYVAPEICIGDFNPRSDIFSLGSILYWLMVGGAPSFINPLLERTRILLEGIDYVYSNKINLFLLQDEMFRQKLIGPIGKFAERYSKMPYKWRGVFEQALSGPIASRYKNIDDFLNDYEVHIAAKSAKITVIQEGTGDKITREGAKRLPDIRILLRASWADWFQVSAWSTFESITDAEGTCVISGIVPGDYLLEIRTSGTEFEPRRNEQVDISADLDYFIELKKRRMIDRLLRRG